MNLQTSVDFQSKQSRGFHQDMTDLLKDMREMSGLLMKVMVRISKLEMRVELLSEELKGKSKGVDLTGEEDKENEDVDVLGSPFCLEPRRNPMMDVAVGMLWTAQGRGTSVQDTMFGVWMRAKVV